ncbi:integral membrane protein [Botrytis cinerea]
MANTPLPDGEPQWNSKPQFRLPGWAEPIMVASILFGSMVLTRRHGYKIFDRRRNTYGLLSEEPDSARSRRFDVDVEISPKKRRCCGTNLLTPNTSRFRDYYHSRILQKFPFLIEMFYWIVTYAFYRCTKILSQAMFSKMGIWDVAQDHGLAILEFEEFSWMSFLWPVREQDVQKWFLNGHGTLLTVLNRSYALIHIPGTVGTISYNFCNRSPHHDSYQSFRLLHLYPLPMYATASSSPEYGFLDSVGRNNAQSVWMQGNYVNSLAAMPSMHFGYSFCIGVTLIYHSGLFRRNLETGEKRKNKFWMLFYVFLGLAYPLYILITIVATANHYYLDAFVAFFVAIAAFLCNRIFLILLPVEDLLFWCLRLEKPIPTTGDRFRRKSSR